MVKLKVRSLLRWALLLFVVLLLAGVPTASATDFGDDDDGADDLEDSSNPGHAAEEEPSEVVTVNDGSADDDEDLVEEQALFSAAPGVETVYMFPSFPTKAPEIHAGQSSVLVIGVDNSGDFPITVQAVRGALVWPADYRIAVQNFTTQLFNTTIPPGIQASFAFPFKPDKQLQAFDFAMTALVLYTIDSQLYASIGYNGTLEILEAKGSVSGETIFLLLLAAALVGLGGTWAHGNVQAMKKKAKKAKKVESSGATSDDAATNEWLQGTSLSQKQSRNVAQQTRSKKKRI